MTDFDTAIAAFTPTPTADASRSALQERLTTKFLLPATIAASILAELTERYTLLLAGDQRTATYRTLHFDTEDLAFFHAHRRGYRRREKARIRHYDDRRLSYFEIKLRINAHKTIKQRCVREYGDDVLHAEDLALLAQYTGIDGRLVPQVWTLFQRLTLVNVRDDERVTLDFDLRFRDGDREVERTHAAIIEVKQPRLCRHSPVMRVLQRHGIRAAEFSKYCAAIVALRAGVRHNRLLPRLRAFERIKHE